MPPKHARTLIEQSTPSCIDCGAPVAELVGGVSICGDCLAVRGACCQEFGGSDLTLEPNAPTADASPVGSGRLFEDEHTIQHDLNAMRFQTRSGARLEYERTETHLDVTHTFVPENLRGQKLAAILMDRIIDYAQQEELGLSGSCSYAASYLKRKDFGMSKPGAGSN